MKKLLTGILSASVLLGLGTAHGAWNYCCDECSGWRCCDPCERTVWKEERYVMPKAKYMRKRSTKKMMAEEPMSMSEERMPMMMSKQSNTDEMMAQDAPMDDNDVEIDESETVEVENGY